MFAREFFLVSDRVNLPEVPACIQCNLEKSKFEHYLTTILPFAGRHPAAKMNLKEMVPKRLAKNLKLHRSLSKSQRKMWVRETNSLIVNSTILPVNTEQLEKLFVMIAKGLVWYHWKTYLNSEHFIEVHFLTKAGEEKFDKEFFSLNVDNSVRKNYGNGTVYYEGLQENSCPEMTVWRFSFYGGMALGEQSKYKEISRCIGVITGPLSLKKNVVA